MGCRCTGVVSGSRQSSRRGGCGHRQGRTGDGRQRPEQLAVLGGEAERLRVCLEKLSPGRAEAVKAAYMEGYSYQELADRLQQPLNTVRSWLRRSLITLKQCLSP